MKSSQSSTEFDQNNTSILGYVVKKNSSSGAKHGPSERQRMYCQANRCLGRPVSESTNAIQEYFHDGTPVNRTEIRCLPSGGKKHTLLYD